MTVPYKPARRVVENTGSIATIAIDFPVEKTTDVKVYAGLPGVQQLALGTDYTVDGIGGASAVVNIVNPAGWGGYDVFAVYVEYVVDQNSDVDSGGTLGKRFEDALDRQTRVLQSFKDQVDRAIKLPVTSPTGSDNVLYPEPNGFLAWDAAGENIETKTGAELAEAIGVGTAAFEDVDAFATSQQGANADLALSIVQTLAMPAGENFPPITDLVLGQKIVPVPGGYTAGVIGDVHLNGSLLTPMLDYVAYDGANIVLLADTGLTAAHIPAIITGKRVTTVAGLAGLDNRYIKRSEIGMNSGNVLRYDDPFGQNIQVIPVRSDSYVWFRRPDDKETDGQTVQITRNPRGYTGAFSGTQHALKVQTIIEERTNQFEWNMLSILEIREGSNGGGEHCATYSQMVKKGDSSGWALCLEARDHVQAPTTGTITGEFGMFVKGLDPLNRRIGIHMALNAADNLPIFDTGLINQVGAGMVIGGPSTHVSAKSMVIFQGDAEMHLDLTEIDQGYHDVAMGVLPDSKIVVQTPKTVHLDGSRDRGATVASMFWSSAFQTWAFGGTKTQIPAGALLKYKHEVHDGQAYLIPMHAVPPPTP